MFTVLTPCVTPKRIGGRIDSNADRFRGRRCHVLYLMISFGLQPRTLVEPHARIEQRVQHVCDDAEKDNEHREDKRERLYGRKITALNCKDQKLTEAIHAENLLR